MTCLERFFDRKDICIEEIMYIKKKKGTCICEFYLKNGKIETKYISLRKVKQELPNVFQNINKGVLVNMNYIKCINGYTYHMVDGMIFDGKLKGSHLHKEIKSKIKK